MSKSILGVYKKQPPKKDSEIRIGTPDPTKYHDVSEVVLEGSNKRNVSTLMPGSHGFSGLRGVVIPHSTPLGGSMGNDPYKPQIVYIDPDFTGGQFAVDLGKIDKEWLAKTYNEKYRQTGNIEDAAIETFLTASTEVSGDKLNNREITIKQGKAIQPLNEIRESPLPGTTYVVPKSTPGGGQYKPVHSFANHKPQQIEKPKEPVNNHQEITVNPNQSLLQNVMTQAPQQQFHQRPTRRVTFEIPIIGQPQGQTGHQFVTIYHEVIKHEDNLILIYDHSQAAQVVYFPPVMTDQNGEPLGIAVLVHSSDRESNKLYLACPTGIKFVYNNEEFCILAIEREINVRNE